MLEKILVIQHLSKPLDLYEIRKILFRFTNRTPDLYCFCNVITINAVNLSTDK